MQWIEGEMHKIYIIGPANPANVRQSGGWDTPGNPCFTLECYMIISNWHRLGRCVNVRKRVWRQDWGGVQASVFKLCFINIYGSVSHNHIPRSCLVPLCESLITNMCWDFPGWHFTTILYKDTEFTVHIFKQLPNSMHIRPSWLCAESTWDRPFSLKIWL